MPFYKLFFVFSCVILSSFTSLRADNRFYIANIRVDVKDTSAAQARLKAIALGQRKAFKVLVEQLLSPEDQASLIQPTENQLNTMIQDFEVQNEKNSEVRYIGTFAFQFYPAKVQEFLNQKQKTALSVKANEKILVLPIYEENGKILIWQEDNAWRHAWNQAGDLKAKYILPLGDLTDILDFPEQTALKKELARLQALRERYQAGYILLTILKRDTPFELSLYLYDGEGLTYTEEDLALLGDITLTPALIQKALNKTTEMVEKFSAEHKLEVTSEKRSVEGRVMFDNHQEWSKIQKILSTLPLVRSFDIVSLQRRQALIRLHYKGLEKYLFQVLEKQGFQVSFPDEQRMPKIVELRLAKKQEPSSVKYPEYGSDFRPENKLKQFDENFYETLEN